MKGKVGCPSKPALRAQRGGSWMSAVSVPVVEARNLRQVYTVRRGMLRPAAQLQAVGNVLHAASCTLAGRRIGLWQVDAGAW